MSAGLASCMKAPVALWPGTVPRTQASVTVDLRRSGRGEQREQERHDESRDACGSERRT